MPLPPDIHSEYPDPALTGDERPFRVATLVNLLNPTPDTLNPTDHPIPPFLHAAVAALTPLLLENAARLNPHKTRFQWFTTTQMRQHQTAIYITLRIVGAASPARGLDIDISDKRRAHVTPFTTNPDWSPDASIFSLDMGDTKSLPDSFYAPATRCHTEADFFDHLHSFTTDAILGHVQLRRERIGPFTARWNIRRGHDTIAQDRSRLITAIQALTSLAPRRSSAPEDERWTPIVH
ncbi:MAG: hypothetical protein AB7G17_01995 [Phycisphaerales bacterium]